MTVSKEQVYRYCKPFLRRKTFRFSRLEGAVKEERMRILRLGEKFAKLPGESDRFVTALRYADGRISDPIRHEIAGIRAKPDATREDWDEAVGKMRKAFIDNGVFTDFGRPSSVGLILNQTNILGVDTYFILGNSHSGVIESGRLNMDKQRPTLMINVTNAAGRLMEILDVMFSESDPLMRNHDQRLVREIMLRHTLGSEGACLTLDEMSMMRNMIRMDEDRLMRADLDVPPEDFPVLSAIDVITTRASIARLERSMAESDCPEEFIIKAVNSHAAAKLAHETSHIIERKANGALRMDKRMMELLGYLIEATHFRADIAFSALLAQAGASTDKNLIDIRAELPDLTSDLVGLNGAAFRQKEDYIRGWAQRCMESIFIRLTGKKPDDIIDVRPVEALRGTEFIGKEHLPLLEKALCNPTLRSSL